MLYPISFPVEVALPHGTCVASSSIHAYSNLLSSVLYHHIEVMLLIEQNVFQAEYEASRTELLEELQRGTSVEELQSKLTKRTDAVEEKVDSVETPRSEIPDDLVQVQAYIRWEKAGKPNYSPEKQLVMILS